MVEASGRVLHKGNCKLAIKQLRRIIYNGRGGTYLYLDLYQGQGIGDRLITIGIHIGYHAYGEVGLSYPTLGGGKLGHLGARTIGYKHAIGRGQVVLGGGLGDVPCYKVLDALGLFSYEFGV